MKLIKQAAVRVGLFILDYFEKEARQPTLEQICNGVGYSSVGTAAKQVARLVDAGVLVRRGRGKWHPLGGEYHIPLGAWRHLEAVYAKRLEAVSTGSIKTGTYKLAVFIYWHLERNSGMFPTYEEIYNAEDVNGEPLRLKANKTALGLALARLAHVGVLVRHEGGSYGIPGATYHIPSITRDYLKEAARAGDETDYYDRPERSWVTTSYHRFGPFAEQGRVGGFAYTRVYDPETGMIWHEGFE